MQIILEARGESCVLRQKTVSSSVAFDVPIEYTDLKTAICDMLNDPERKEIMIDAVMVDRTREAIRVHAGNGSFAIPYPNIFPLVMDA